MTENSVSAVSVPESNTCTQYVPASAVVMICGDADGPVTTDWARLHGAAVAGNPTPSPALTVPFPSVTSVIFTVPAVVMAKVREVPPFTDT